MKNQKENEMNGYKMIDILNGYNKQKFQESVKNITSIKMCSGDVFLNMYDDLTQIPDIKSEIKSRVDDLLDSNPYYGLFHFGTNIGEIMEQILVESFSKLTKQPDESKTNKFDLYYYDKRVEVKSCRAFTKVDKLNPSTVSSRSIRCDEIDKTISNGSFQQVKTACFDYLIGLMIYTDRIDIYCTTNDDFTFDKLDDTRILLSGQHRGNVLEGQTGSLGKMAPYKIAEIDNRFNITHI